MGDWVQRGVNEMNLKLTTSFFLPAAFILLLVGCGEDTSPPVPPTATPTAASTQVPPTPTAGHTPTATTIAMPDFELPDTSGSTVSLSKTLSHSHFAILVFYRGHF